VCTVFKGKTRHVLYKKGGVNGGTWSSRVQSHSQVDWFTGLRGSEGGVLRMTPEKKKKLRGKRGADFAEVGGWTIGEITRDIFWGKRSSCGEKSHGCMSRRATKGPKRRSSALGGTSSQGRPNLSYEHEKGGGPYMKGRRGLPKGGASFGNKSWFK